MTFRSAYDCLPDHLKTAYAPEKVFSVHAFRDDERGADVICDNVSGPEALDALREAVADSQNMSAFACRRRPDGTSQILYLVEMEERFVSPVFETAEA